MTLDRALYILAQVHTRDDVQTGFNVQMGAMPDYFAPCSHSEYVEAWKAVREHVHLQTEPELIT